MTRELLGTKANYEINITYWSIVRRKKHGSFSIQDTFEHAPTQRAGILF